jgi:uncharacterized protein
VRTAAETFVPNPKVDTAAVLSQLAVGEALVSTLQDKGVPMPVERTLMAPPRCRMGAITPEERTAVRARSPVGAKYDVAVNRESAYEILSQRAAPSEGPPPAAEAPAPAPRSGRTGAAPAASRRRGADTPAEPATTGGGLSELLWGTSRRQGMVEALAKQTARTVGSEVGRQILRGVLGGILGGSRRR